MAGAAGSVAVAVVAVAEGDAAALAVVVGVAVGVAAGDEAGTRSCSSTAELNLRNKVNRQDCTVQAGGDASEPKATSSR